MQAADSHSLVPKAVEDALRPRTEATLRAAMSEFKQQFGSQPEEEYTITVLVCKSDDAQAQEDEVRVARVLIASTYLVSMTRGAHWLRLSDMSCDSHWP